MQPEALAGEMLADRRDRQIGGCLTAAGFGQAVAEMPGAVGATLHLDDQRAPFRAWTPVLLPIGARILAPMVEELHVFALQRLDLGLDESVEFREFGRYFRRQFEVHVRVSLASRSSLQTYRTLAYDRVNDVLSLGYSAMRP